MPVCKNGCDAREHYTRLSQQQLKAKYFGSVINGLCLLQGKHQLKSLWGNIFSGGRNSSLMDLVL